MLRKEKATFAPGVEIPATIKRLTTMYMNRYYLSCMDAFDLAIREHFDICPERLQAAWTAMDLREYMPAAYLPEYLDFEKYPLNY